MVANYLTFTFQERKNIFDKSLSTVGPRLIGPIGTEDFSPLSQDNLSREVK